MTFRQAAFFILQRMTQKKMTWKPTSVHPHSAGHILSSLRTQTSLSGGSASGCGCRQSQHTSCAKPLTLRVEITHARQWKNCFSLLSLNRDFPAKWELLRGESPYCIVCHKKVLYIFHCCKNTCNGEQCKVPYKITVTTQHPLRSSGFVIPMYII